MDDYGVIRMRGEELVRQAEQARLAGQARRLGQPGAARSVVARAAERVVAAAARVWRGRRTAADRGRAPVAG